MVMSSSITAEFFAGARHVPPPPPLHNHEGERGSVAESNLAREEEEEEEEEGWITPNNLQQACERMGGATEEPAVGVAVGCITTDFAMQVCVGNAVCVVLCVHHLALRCLLCLEAERAASDGTHCGFTGWHEST